MAKSIKVSKYIYQYGDDFYKIAFHRTDKVNNNRIDVEEYVHGSLDDALELRARLLNKYNLKLEKEKSSDSKSVKVSDYIYKLPNGNYRVLIRKTKKMHNGFDKTYPTIELAEKRRDEFFAKNTLGMDEQSDITVEAFCEVFMDYMKSSKKSDATLKNYKGNINHDIIPFFGKRKLKDIQTFELQNFFLQQSNRMADNYNSKGKKITGNTVHHIYAAYRTILNKAVAWKYIRENPLKGVEIPSFKAEESKVFLYDDLGDVFDKVSKIENTRNKCIFTIVLCTGMRESEVAGIHIDDIDFVNNILKVRQNIVQNFETKQYYEGNLKTDDSDRDIPVPEFCMDAIRLYLKDREKMVEILKIRNKDYVELPNLFFNKDGDFMRPYYIGKLWLKFRRKNNLEDVKFHGIRHTYCTVQANHNDNLSISDVQYLMGHADKSTTFHYMHKDENNIKGATSVFDKFSSKSDGNICIESISAIITGRTDIVDANVLMRDMSYILESEINLYNVSSSFEKCKDELLKLNPDFESMNVLSKKYNDNDQFLQVITRVFGKNINFNDNLDKNISLNL